MKFRLFIPGLSTARESALDEIGLGHMRTGASFVYGQHDGKSGHFVFWDEPSIDSTSWHWIPAISIDDLPEGRYSVGIPPSGLKPNDLQRTRQFDGHWVTLGDGNQWLFPSAGRLPAYFTREAGRKVSHRVRKEFEWYFNEAGEWYCLLINQDDPTQIAGVDVKVFDFMARGLTLNYQLTPEVINHLELFGTDNVFHCLRAAVDALTIEIEDRSQKKSIQDA